MTAEELMGVLSSDNPRSRRHREETMGADGMGYSMWSCIPIRDVVPFRNRLIDAASEPAAASLRACLGVIAPRMHDLAIEHEGEGLDKLHPAVLWERCPDETCAGARRLLGMDAPETDPIFVQIILGFSVQREEARPRAGQNVMVDWARRWLDRHGFETTEAPTIYLDGTDDADPGRRQFRWEMRVRQAAT